MENIEREQGERAELTAETPVLEREQSVQESRHHVESDIDHADATSTKQKSLTSLFVMGIGGMISLAIIGAGAYGYISAKKGNLNVFATAAIRAFDMPVAVVNGDNISYADFDQERRTLKYFISQAGGQFGPVPTDEQIDEQVLSRLMVNAIIDQLADELQVSTNDADVATARENILKNYASVEAADAEFQTKYQWSFDEYVERIVKPYVKEKAVTDAFITSTAEAFASYASGEERKASHILFSVSDEKGRREVKKTAERVLKEIKDGANFEDMAKQYGSDGTAQNGGDLGWFGKGAMVPPFEKAVFEGEVGQLIPTLVETDFGYHIVKVAEARTGKNFDKLMQDRLSQAEVVTYMGQKNPYGGYVINTAQ